MQVKFNKFYDELLKLTGRVNNLGNVKAEEYRIIVRETLRALAIASPQWSGYFASNWRVSVGGLSLSRGELGYQQEVQAAAALDKFKGGDDWTYGNQSFSPDRVKFRGDAEAIDFCLQANEPIIAKIRSAWVRVTFTNDTPYGPEIAQNNRREVRDEDGDVMQPGGAFLRPGNYIDPKPIPLGYVKTILPTIVRR